MPLFRRSLFLAASIVVLLISSANAEKFRSAVLVRTSAQTTVFAVDDLNGDGLPDFAYLTSSPTINMVIQLATGPQTYGVSQSFPLAAPLFPRQIAIADLNGDGRKDIIVDGTNNEIGFVAVFLNISNGTFQTPIMSTVLTDSNIFPSPGEIAVADFDGDGKADIAVTNAAGSPISGNLFVVKGDGAGNFTPMFASTDRNPAIHIAVADFNQDGHPDLLIQRFLAGDVVIFIGDGHGQFTSKVYNHDPFFNTPNVPIALRSVIVADMNGDQYPDLVVSTNDTVEVMLNDTTGNFVDAPVGPGIQLTLDFIQVDGASDFNHDGKPDIAVATNDGLNIYFGNGNFTFPTRATYWLPPSGIKFSDLDGDGELDAVAPAINGLAIAYGNHDGSLRAAVAFPVGGVQNTALADVNHNGISDVVAATASGPVSLLSNGNGTFSTVANSGPLLMTSVGDFNGDGKPDLLSSNGGSMVQLSLGNGDGTFQSAADYITRLTGIMLAGDFNNDGKPDVGFGVVSSGFTMGFQVVPNPVSGTFPASPPVVNSVLQGVVGDFNKDGKLDAAFSGDQDVVVFLGNGDGTFQAPQINLLPHNVDQLYTVDYNNDGKLDLLGFYGQNQYQLLLGKGDGTFNDATTVSTPNIVYASVASGFLKGDSHPDLVFSDGGVVYILNRNTDETLQAPLLYPAPGVNPLLADFNGDGTTDIAIGGGSSSMVVLLNCGGTNSSLTDSVSPQSQFGQPVTFSATLTAVGSGCGTPSGSASLTDNGTTLKTALLVSGKISVTTSTLTVGTHTIAGSYAGDSVFNSRNFSSISHTIVKADTTTTVSGTPNPALVGQSVTLSAQVSPAFTGLPTGAVTFSDGANMLGQANLDSAGVATLVLNNLAVRTISITANYAGDSRFNPSSGTVTQHITDFNLSAIPDSQTISAGQTASYPVSVNPLAGFQGTVNLSCSGAPQLATCMISPTSATPNGGAASVNVTVNTTASVAGIPSGASSQIPHFLVVMGPGIAGILLIPFCRTKQIRTLRMITALMCMLILPSCGGGGGSPTPHPGTPPGTSTVVITGTTSAGLVTVTHTLNLTLTVH